MQFLLGNKKRINGELSVVTIKLVTPKIRAHNDDFSTRRIC